METGNKLTLKDFEKYPEEYTWELQTDFGEKITFRPLLHSDIKKLTSFLESLSTETRRLSTFDSYDKVTARELCSAISKYDKLRFVLENEKEEIIGLIEFTLDIPQSIIGQYTEYQIRLDRENTCRFGPTLSDQYQSKGLGNLLFPYILKIVKLLNKKQIILYGGVLVDNTRAINYYQKHGFEIVGKFKDAEGVEKFDMILSL